MKIKIILTTSIIILLLLTNSFCYPTFGFYAREVSFHQMWKFKNGIKEEFSTSWYGYPGNIHVDKNNSIIYTDYSNRFVTLNLDTGEEIFSVSAPTNQVFTKFVVDKDSIFIVQCPRDSDELFFETMSYLLIKLNKETGKEIWRREIIANSYLFSNRDFLIVASFCCPYLIYISKDTGVTTKEVFLSNLYIKNRRYLRLYPDMFKEQYLYWISSPVNKDEGIIEIMVFDTEIKEQIAGIPIKTEITEEAYFKIICIDEENIIIERFADLLCWYNPSELICYNLEKKEVIWKQTFSEENHVRTIFTSDVNKEAYYLICKSSLIIAINKNTGRIIDEYVLIQDEISKISSYFEYYPVGVSTWKEYAWFRLEHTIFMVNLKTEKLVFKILEGEEFSYLDITNGIFLGRPPLASIILNQNADNEIDLLIPLGNQLICGTFFIRKLSKPPNLLSANLNFQQLSFQQLSCKKTE